MFPGSGRKFAFQKVVANRLAGGCHLQQFLQSRQRRDIGDHLADDLFFGEAYGLGLTIVDAEVPKLDGVQ